MLVTEVRTLPVDAPPDLVNIASVDVSYGFPSPPQDLQTSEIDLNEHLMLNRFRS